MLRRSDRVPGSGRAPVGRSRRRRDRAARGRVLRVRNGRDRFLVVRWVIVGVWAALLATRIVVAARNPDGDLVVFGLIEGGAVLLGLAVIGIGLRRAWLLGRRREDDALGLAIRRVDPTVWLLPATPTQELREAVATVKPDLVLGHRVTWAFGATEASLWELDERRATRVLVIRWSRMVHVGTEDVVHGRRARVPAIALHYVRSDDSSAVATFHVRRGGGSGRLLGRGPRLDRLVGRLAQERIVA